MISLILAGETEFTKFNKKSRKDFLTYIQKISKISEVKLLSNSNLSVVPEFDSILSLELKVPKNTSGALATALFGLDQFDDNTPYLLAPSNAIIDFTSLVDFLDVMQAQPIEVGAIVFKGENPIYSYVRLNTNSEPIEIVEKVITGNCALAGFYYFANKKLFLDCAKWAMVNNVRTNNKFYISPALNYFIAENIKIRLYEVPSGNYHRLK